MLSRRLRSVPSVQAGLIVVRRVPLEELSKLSEEMKGQRVPSCGCGFVASPIWQPAVRQIGDRPHGDNAYGVAVALPFMIGGRSKRMVNRQWVSRMLASHRGVGPVV